MTFYLLIVIDNAFYWSKEKKKKFLSERDLLKYALAKRINIIYFIDNKRGSFYFI